MHPDPQAPPKPIKPVKLEFNLPELGDPTAQLVIERIEKGRISLYVRWDPRKGILPITVELRVGKTYDRQYAVIELPSKEAIQDGGLPYREMNSDSVHEDLKMASWFPTGATPLKLTITANGKKTILTATLAKEDPSVRR